MIGKYLAEGNNAFQEPLICGKKSEHTIGDHISTWKIKRMIGTLKNSMFTVKEPSDQQ